MLGTIALIALAAAGYAGVNPLVIGIGAIVNGFIGLHHPPGKAETLRARGAYWGAFFTSLPIHLVFAAATFGIGWALAAIT